VIFIYARSDHSTRKTTPQPRCRVGPRTCEGRRENGRVPCCGRRASWLDGMTSWC